MEDEYEYKITCGRQELITIKCGIGGATVDEIASILSDEAANAFRETIGFLMEEPDNVKRNAEYAYILDDLDSITTNPFFGGISWRDHEYVTLKDYSSEAVNEIRRINLHISKKGRGGLTAEGGLFCEAYHIGLEEGNEVHFINWVGRILPNGKITLSILDDLQNGLLILENEAE